MKNLSFALALVCFFASYAQSPTDVIKIKEPNEKYLEHLIKTKIDSIRATWGYKTMANDSGLYITSKSHANYLSENSKIGHTQMNEDQKTPGIRLAHFGVRNYQSFEFVNSIYVHRSVKVRLNPNEKETISKTFYTYADVANQVVKDWMLDKDTKEDFENTKYNVIGLAVTINQLNDCIKVVAFMGRPYLKYQFTESKTLFPYSGYKTEERITSFDQIKGQKNLDRPYKLIEGVQSKCAKCEEYFKNVQFKLNVSAGKVYLTAEGIENISEFQKHIASSKNGFMLETILYEDYHPGNPAYYTKATRRNGNYLYNGEVFQPIMGEEAVNGFDADKGTLKLVLARDPKIAALYDYNVYFIYKNMVCNIQRFTDPVGDPLALYQNQKLDYYFSDKTISLLQIQQNREVYNQLLTFKNNNFELDTLKFNTSIKKLQTANAAQTEQKIVLQLFVPLVETSTDSLSQNKAIVNRLENKIAKLYPNIKISVVSNSNTLALKEHYKGIKNPAKANLSKEEWTKLLSDPKELKANKSVLDKSWLGNIIYIQSQDSVSSLFQQYTTLLTKTDTMKIVSLEDQSLLEELQKQLFTHKNIASKATEIAAINTQPKHDSLKTMYLNQMIAAYNQNSMSEEQTKKLYEQLLANYTVAKPLTIDKINFLKFSCNAMTDKPYDYAYKSNVLLADLKILKPTISEEQFNKLNNAYEIKLTYYYSNYEKAKKLFDENLEILYNKYKELDQENQYNLALTLAYYKETKKLNDLLEPYLNSDQKAPAMLALYNKINQSYVDFYGNTDKEYLSTVLDSRKALGDELWCKQFVGKGNISFQIFDYLPIYKQYCEVCNAADNASKEFGY